MPEPLWRPQEIENALGLPSQTRDGIPAITGVSIDSRTLEPGDLFVAIKGERADGHNYVDAAFGRGAAAAIVSADFAARSSLPAARLFAVCDTLDALNRLGMAARARSEAKFAAITGSVGKTGTKEMLRAMLLAQPSSPSESWPGLTRPSSATSQVSSIDLDGRLKGGRDSLGVHASEKSYNNLWGVPLSLARMPAASLFGVYEIGMNHAGEITPLVQMVRPHVAMITWIAPVHIEFFESEEAIADAKAEIFAGLEPGGHAVLPADNRHFARLAAHALAKGVNVVPFGEGEMAAARLLDREPTEAGSRIGADILGERISFTLSAPGKHLASNAVGALAAARLLGADVKAAAEALGRFQIPEGRGRRERFETRSGAVLLIDETYNANPASMRAALEVLGSVSRKEFPRRVAVLGDMLELGHGAAQFHSELASAIDLSCIDLVFCAGPLMTHLFERLPAARRGAAAETSEALTQPVLEAVRGGDAVMIKGSLGSRMRPLADALRLHLGELARNA